MKKLFSLFFILIAHAGSLSAQSDTALISAIIKDIEASQFKQDGEFYTGMFAGYRQCAGFPHNYQPDNNIFFTAITAFTLKNIVPQLNTNNKTTALQIVKNTTTAYPHYINNNGKPFYSFWPTNAPILPHSYFINRFNGIFAQGDDADDSVMILMSADDNKSDNKALKERLIQVSNLKKSTETFLHTALTSAKKCTPILILLCNATYCISILKKNYRL
jgi:hypothetical protein